MASAQKIIKARDALKSKRSTYRMLCDEVARLFSPDMQDLLKAPEGSEILQPITSTGILAQERMTSGLFSNTMSMGRGNIIDQDPIKMKMSGVPRFYTALSKTTHRRIQTSPFPEKYEELLRGFDLRGEGVMYVYFNGITKEHEFSVYPSVRCFPVRDSKGAVVEMYREYELTALQAVLDFGHENVSEVVQKAFNRDDHDVKFEFIHCVRPRRERNAKRLDAANMRFESVHVEVGQKKVVRESGTKRMRYLMPRCFVRDGEDCGRSPAMLALPVARTLMQVVKDHMDGMELQIGPPIFLPDAQAVERAVLKAFTVNYCDMSNSSPFVYDGKGNLQLSADFIKVLSEEINKLHYVDLFAMLEQIKTGQKTAYEISQLVAERIQAISPVVNRLSSGFFAPLYEIVAEDILEHKLLNEPAPSVLRGSEFRVLYTSRLDVQLADLELSIISQAIAASADEHGVRLIGLSALMTTTVTSMKETISRLREGGYVHGIMVGGAVLTPEYAEMIGADFYAKDAQEAVRTANRFFGV